MDALSTAVTQWGQHNVLVTSWLIAESRLLPLSDALFKVGKNDRKVSAGVSNRFCNLQIHLTSIFLTKHVCVWSSPCSSVSFPSWPFYLFSLPHTHTHTHIHTHRQASTHSFIFSWQGVSRSRWRALCHMLNHPSVAACLHIAPGTQHTNTTKPKETSTLQQFRDNKFNSNTCERRDHSQDIRQRLTVKQQNNWHLCWLQLFSFLSVHFKPWLLLPFYEKDT